MIVPIIIPIFVIGLISSLVTELLKLFPALSKTDNRKRVVAFIAAFVISLLYLISGEEYRGFDALVLITGACSTAFTIYKSVIQVFRPPVESEEK